MHPERVEDVTVEITYLTGHVRRIRRLSADTAETVVRHVNLGGSHFIWKGVIYPSRWVAKAKVKT